MTPININMLCFRYHPEKINDEEKINQLNEKLLHMLNQTGKIFLTHTKINNRYTLRLVIGQTNVTGRHIDKAWSLICTSVKNIA
jgi:aromatic-L-amino-acid decarboxylase